MRTSSRQIFLMALFLAGMKVPFIAAQTPAPMSTPIAHPVYPSGTSSPLGEQIVTLLADPGVARAHWGIAVTMLDGTPIWGLDEGKLFRPASNAKLYTLATALSLIDSRRTLHTTVWGNAPDANGVVNGDLKLMGAGDPSFSTTDIPYLTPAQRKAAGIPDITPDPLQGLDDLASQVAAQGVKHVSGGIIGSDALWVWEPYPDTWGVDDLTTDDGAPVSALTVNDNTVVLKIMPGAKPGDNATATLSPGWTGYALAIDVKTVAANTSASIGIDRAVGSKTIRIFGTVAIGAPRSRSLAIDDPAQFAAAAFRNRLIAHGVSVDGTSQAEHRLFVDPKGFTAESHEPLAPAALQTTNASAQSSPCDQIVKTGEAAKPCVFPMKLADHASAPLADEVTVTMKVSENLHAEMLLRELGQEHGAATVPMLSEPSTIAQGARVVRQFLLNAGLDGDDFLFYDGSGLSSHDLVTPRTTAQLLSFATTQPWFATWKASLPIGGVDGTLSSRFKDAPLKGRVYAKTGTLGESRGLSGYLDCASGKQVIFSIFVDGHTPVTPADRIAMDNVVAAIAVNN